MVRKALTLLAALAVSACASNVSYRPLDEAPAPVDDLVASVYLVGDAGENTPGRDAVVAHLQADLERHLREHARAPALVAFLGDNIYDVGARETHREEDLAKLAAQVGAVAGSPRVRGVFLPGNHDWGMGAEFALGRTAVEVQEAWLQEVADGRNVGFLPADGCPGPATVRVAADVHVLFMDTEWLIRRPEDVCGGPEAFYRRLEESLRGLAGQRVILTSHHPMATGGPHGGNVSAFDNGPFVYFLAVKSGLSAQDLSSGRYSAMLHRLRSAIERSGVVPMAIASGHDHSLQVIRTEEVGSPRFQLVSGSASKSSPVARVDGMRFGTSDHGYMRLDFGPGDTRLVVFSAETPDQLLRPVFACTLAGPGDVGSCPAAVLEDGG